MLDPHFQKPYTLSLIYVPYEKKLLTLYFQQKQNKIPFDQILQIPYLGLNPLCRISKKNYETYNNKRKEQVFASKSKFQKKRNRLQVTDNESQIACNK